MRNKMGHPSEGGGAKDALIFAEVFLLRGYNCLPIFQYVCAFGGEGGSCVCGGGCACECVRSCVHM